MSHERRGFSHAQHPPLSFFADAMALDDLTPPVDGVCQAQPGAAGRAASPTHRLLEIRERLRRGLLTRPEVLWHVAVRVLDDLTLGDPMPERSGLHDSATRKV